MAIQSFSDKATKSFFGSGKLPHREGWAIVAKVVLRKLDMLNYASELYDLKSPPNNFLEALKHNLKGYHSIRVNKQWRIVFRWTQAGPEEVRICDYH